MTSRRARPASEGLRQFTATDSDLRHVRGEISALPRLLHGQGAIAFTFGLGVLVPVPDALGARRAIAKRAWSRGGDCTAAPGTRLATAPTMDRAMLRGSWSSRRCRACISAGERPGPSRRPARAHRIASSTASAHGDVHIFIAPRAEERSSAVGTPVPGYEAGRRPRHAAGPDRRGGPPRRTRRDGCRYLAAPRQTEYVVDGWNLTGDSFRRDEDG